MEGSVSTITVIAMFLDDIPIFATAQAKVNVLFEKNQYHLSMELPMEFSPEQKPGRMSFLNMEHVLQQQQIPTTFFVNSQAIQSGRSHSC